MMIQAICWVLIHSLWQGAVLAVAAGCVLAGTRQSAAAVRYRLLGGLLFLFLAACGLTFLYELYLAGEIGGVGESVNTAAADALAAGSGMLRRYCEANAAWIVCAWFVVAAVKAVRMAGGWGYVHAISRHGHTQAPEQWVRLVERWAEHLGIRRRVRLLESRLVKAPMVVGHLKPVIFIPLGFINHLPPDEIESVLLHELAHIWRHDYLVNLMQQLSECVLFFNPGLLWVSSLLREERENCCDDIAIAQTGDRVRLVRALVRIKEHSMGVAVVAFRPGGKRQLLRRILRIAQRRNQGFNGGERFFLSASCLVLLVLLLSVHRVGGGMVAESRRSVQGQAMDGQVEKNREQVETNRLQAQRNKEQDELNQLKAERDPTQVSREQAELDRMQAERERMQVERDREQAVKDHAQAELDRMQADRDRQQAERDKEQADRDRQQADRDRQQADRDKHQADLQRQQAERQQGTKTTTTVTTTITTGKE